MITNIGKIEWKDDLYLKVEGRLIEKKSVKELVGLGPKSHK